MLHDPLLMSHHAARSSRPPVSPASLAGRSAPRRRNAENDFEVESVCLHVQPGFSASVRPSVRPREPGSRPAAAAGRSDDLPARNPTSKRRCRRPSVVGVVMTTMNAGGRAGWLTGAQASTCHEI